MEAVDGTPGVLAHLIHEETVEVDRLADQERASRRAGDWYEAWEVGNEIKRRRMEISAIHIMRAVAEWASARDPEQFAQLVKRLPESLTRIFLHCPDPPPEQLRPRRPSEIPWEIFVYLEGGIDNRPSIWDQVIAGCKTMMCNTVREVVASPFVECPIERSWLSSEVVRLCYTMRRTGNYDQMERLGELLADQGCGDSDILLHCVRDGHCRGCWLVDAIIGRRLCQFPSATTDAAP